MKKHLIIVFAALTLVACKKESYDSGDGELSYMRADFGEVHTQTAKILDYAITDDGEKVAFVSKMSCPWALKGDSLYRALFYYKRVDDAHGTEPIAVSQVPVLRFNEPSDTAKLVTDPVKFESAWMSSNGKYLNLGFAIMTGKAESNDSKQTIGAVCTAKDGAADGTTTWHITLYHAQNGVPEYYSSRMFASIPTEKTKKGDRIIITVNTYGKPFVKEFIVSK